MRRGGEASRRGLVGLDGGALRSTPRRTGGPTASALVCLGCRESLGSCWHWGVGQWGICHLIISAVTSKNKWAVRFLQPQKQGMAKGVRVWCITALWRRFACVFAEEKWKMQISQIYKSKPAHHCECERGGGCCKTSSVMQSERGREVKTGEW